MKCFILNRRAEAAVLNNMPVLEYFGMIFVHTHTHTHTHTVMKKITYLKVSGNIFSCDSFLLGIYPDFSHGGL
jgi:hypothetical protein